MTSFRRSVYEWLEPGEQSSVWEHVADFLLIGMILASVAIGVMQSMPELAHYEPVLSMAERWIVYLFTAEYLLRLWSCPERDSSCTGWRARLRFALKPMSLVDLAAILPFFLEGFAGANTVVFRLLRIFRLVRVLKFGRYHSSMGLLGKVLKLRKEELMISTVLVLALVVITSTLIYAVEHDAQPKAFASIPASMWWGIVTLTTVGYGDVYPVTAAGKVIAGISVMLGLGLFALPAGILASGFSEELAKSKKKEKACRSCPHCGKDVPLD